VVRHRLVSDIVDAYARWDAERENQQGQQGVHAVPGRAARAGRRR
jgi:phosphate starvation-inducible PhoH-like protein